MRIHKNAIFEGIGEGIDGEISASEVVVKRGFVLRRPADGSGGVHRPDVGNGEGECFVGSAGSDVPVAVGVLGDCAVIDEELVEHWRCDIANEDVRAVRNDAEDGVTNGTTNEIGICGRNVSYQFEKKAE